MCKHVAATLYGIGARLDEDPSLFFKLRQADTEDLVARAVKDKTGELLARSKKKSARVIDNGDLSGIFGIDMEGIPDFVANKRKPERIVSKKATPAGRKKKRQEPQKKPKKATDLVVEIIGRNKSGTTVAMLVEQTGFSATKIYGITSRLRQQGRIIYVAQGVYGAP